MKYETSSKFLVNDFYHTQYISTHLCYKQSFVFIYHSQKHVTQWQTHWKSLFNKIFLEAKLSETKIESTSSSTVFFITMHLRFKKKIFLIFILVTIIFLIRHYSTYLMFLISRGWYEWVTFNSKSNVTVVNVLDMSVIDKLEVEKVNEYISDAYLG